MSYEVYVDVRHHPKHCDDYEQRITEAAKLTWESDQDPMPLVANVIRGMAEQIAPEPVSAADERRVWAALNAEVQRVRREHAAAPNTQRAMLTSLMRLADSLGLGDEFLPGVRTMVG